MLEYEYTAGTSNDQRRVAKPKPTNDQPRRVQLTVLKRVVVLCANDDRYYTIIIFFISKNIVSRDEKKK